MVSLLRTLDFGEKVTAIELRCISTQDNDVGIAGGDCTDSLRGIGRNLMPRIAQYSASGFPQSTSVSTTSNFPALECTIVSLKGWPQTIEGFGSGKDCDSC
jgi:hypothetical protein